MKRLLILISFCLITINLFAQHQPGHNTPVDPSSEIWKKLRRLKYEEVNYSFLPKFSDEIKALDGKIITVKGFIIPMQEASNTTYFMLSYYPYSNCYFCGGAGPETIVEVKASKAVIFTSKAITVTGKLKLNKDDEEHLFYILENSSLVD